MQACESVVFVLLQRTQAVSSAAARLQRGDAARDVRQEVARVLGLYRLRGRDAPTSQK
jgi:hypothetical protein